MIPANIRKTVMKRAAGRCEDCGMCCSLELHHLRYRTEPDMFTIDGHDISGRETPDDLMALCRECHQSRHIDPAGEFWRDPEEMADHWQPYFDEMAGD